MRTLIALAPLTLAACLPPAGSYGDILPDDRLLIDEADVSELARSVGDRSEYAQLTREITGEINGGIGEVLGLVDEISSYPPTWADEDQDTALWGPWLDDGIHGQMWVQRHADDAYTWAIEIRPEGSAEDAWVPVLAGEVDPGATDLASRGRFYMDFTAIRDNGGEDDITGEMAVDYEILETGAAATVYFGDISEDGAIPADGGYYFEHERGVGGMMDVAVESDVSDPANGVLETVILRSRWAGGSGGRTDAYVTGGDLGALTYTETECWDAGHGVVFHENNYELTREGDEADCAFTEPSFNET